jgi:large subunit ribosomal protein L7/L12
MRWNKNTTDANPAIGFSSLLLLLLSSQQPPLQYRAQIPCYRMMAQHHPSFHTTTKIYQAAVTDVATTTTTTTMTSTNTNASVPVQEEPTTISTTSTDDGSSSLQYSTEALTADAATHQAGLLDPTRPSYQNPLHHNNPIMMKQFPEDFSTPEEFEAAKMAAPPLQLHEDKVAAPLYIQEIAQEIVHLNMLEMNELINRIGHHYGFDESMLCPDIDDGRLSSADGAGTSSHLDSSDDAATPAAVEKTAFDVKLVSYDDKAKIKIIKEVRAIAALGLKEAKEMVEGAPKVIQKSIKKEKADEIKTKLEELGAVIEIM